MMENYNYAGLDRKLEADARPILEKYTEQLLPGMKSDAAVQGAGGGNRLALHKDALGRNLSRELSDSFARTSLEDIQSIREAQPKYDLTQQNLASMLPMLAQGGAAGNQYMLQLLQQDQMLRQQDIDSQMGSIGMNQEMAMGPLERMFNVLYGSGGGTSTATTTGAKPSGLMGALQGGLGGAMGASALGASMSNPWTMGGIGLMALLGGLG
jgi:hypothetical protein